MDLVTRWPSWYRLPIDNGQRKYRSVISFHGDDRNAWIGPYTLTDSEFAYRIAVIISSAGVTGIGIGQVIAKLFGG